MNCEPITSFTFLEKPGINCQNEPTRFGISILKGLLRDTDTIALKTTDIFITYQIKSINYWFKIIKWLASD